MNSISMNFNFLAFMLYFSFSKTDVCNIQNRKNRTRIRKLRNWEIITNLDFLHLPLSWRRSLPYRNQSIDLQSKSSDWFLYGNGLRHERANQLNIRSEIWRQSPIKKLDANFLYVILRYLKQWYEGLWEWLFRYAWTGDE